MIPPYQSPPAARGGDLCGAYRHGGSAVRFRNYGADCKEHWTVGDEMSEFLKNSKFLPPVRCPTTGQDLARGFGDGNGVLNLHPKCTEIRFAANPKLARRISVGNAVSV